MALNYIIAFVAAFLLALILTPLVKRLALKLNIVDNPADIERKIHKKPTALLGGLAIFLAVATMILIWWLGTDYLFMGSILPKHLIGVLVGALILIIGGFIDDKYNLKPYQQIIWPTLAALSIIAAGIGINEITNPFGGVIALNTWEYNIFWWHGLAYKLTLPSDIFTFVWLMTLMYTTKFLDGLDGLAAGITAIGALMIVFLALFTKFYQPDVALISLIVAGALVGFLMFNFHPAKIFLGEGGSTLCGFFLGTLAVISGGKIATALLVMGIPVLDVVWVILRRMFFEKKSPFKADKKHLHFRLLDIGLSQRRAVLFLYSLTAAFGVCTLFLQSKYKLLALAALCLAMIILALFLVYQYKRSARQPVLDKSGS
ncbi:undecaprenyl/decaprenyl-phosphate alpha-N-acetylglucosaminyl 1-phosphate transferase [Patescibacteria group bacterium]|nr:undecaprenyl/decaprenyl-phosphate alpha-N-acetylglucosaminyl 1-phosphate transferase [Patescibacteria group bacterium]MBU1922576.1 undecaprenyl/decaprenyl-phosphate alpha-N-acetylglucosaminyl 1-phosphate transferase [Patescibacteria group bacterium]